MADQFPVARADRLLAFAVVALGKRHQPQEAHHVHIINVRRHRLRRQAQRIAHVVVGIGQAHGLDIGMSHENHMHPALFIGQPRALADPGVHRRNRCHARAIAPEGLVDRLGLGVLFQHLSHEQALQGGHAVDHEGLVVVRFVDHRPQLRPKVLGVGQQREGIRAVVRRDCLHPVFRPDENGLGKRRCKAGFAHAAITAKGDKHRPVGGLCRRGNQ